MTTEPLTGQPDPVLVTAQGGKLYIALNRPEVLNAQNLLLREMVADAVARLDSDPDLRVAIISGVGGRAFSAGADLKDVEAPRSTRDGSRAPGVPRPIPGQRRPNWVHFEALRWAAKPVIAAIDGYCLGGGLELANYCDIRIATRQSTFGQPEPRNIGATGGPALHQLSRTIPLGEALLMHLTGQPITAQRAYEIGLIQRLCDDRDELLREADLIADQMILCNPEALRVLKRVVKWGKDMTADQVEQMHYLADETRWADHNTPDWSPSWNKRPAPGADPA